MTDDNDDDDNDDDDEDDGDNDKKLLTTISIYIYTHTQTLLCTGYSQVKMLRSRYCGFPLVNHEVVQLLLRAGDEAKLEVKEREACGRIGRNLTCG